MRKALSVFHNATDFVSDVGLQVFVIINTHDSQFLIYCQLQLLTFEASVDQMDIEKCASLFFDVKYQETLQGPLLSP